MRVTCFRRPIPVSQSPHRACLMWRRLISYQPIVVRSVRDDRIRSFCHVLSLFACDCEFLNLSEEVCCITEQMYTRHASQIQLIWRANTHSSQPLHCTFYRLISSLCFAVTTTICCFKSNAAFALAIDLLACSFLSSSDKRERQRRWSHTHVHNQHLSLSRLCFDWRIECINATHAAIL